MFRHPLRPELPALDEATAERLLDGRQLAPHAPEAYRPVADLLAALTAPPSDAELRGAAAAAAAFVTAHAAAARPVRRTRPVAALAVVGFLFVASTGTAVAATEGALPQPVQAVAHEALGVVGISVPGVTPEHPDPAIIATLQDDQPDAPPTGSATVPWVTGPSTAATPDAGGGRPDGPTSANPAVGNDTTTDGAPAGQPTTTPAGDAPTGGPQGSQPNQVPRPEPGPGTQPQPQPQPGPKPAPQPEPQPQPTGPQSGAGARDEGPTGPR